MDTVVRGFAESVAEMCLAKRGLGYAPDDELDEFAGLLTSQDWSDRRSPRPPGRPVPGLRHLPWAIAEAVTAGECPVLEALRCCVGLVPWDTYYLPSDWSSPFLDDFASGELIGPAGYLPSETLALGLFLLGPRTRYSEHAHDSTEIYYVLGGRGAWDIGGGGHERWHGAGDMVYTTPHERHEITTSDSPLLIAWMWKSSPGAPSYYRDRGDWAGGEPVHPALRRG